MKKELEKNLKFIHTTLTSLRIEISRFEVQFIGKKEFLGNIEQVACLWFEQIEPNIKVFMIEDEMINKYSNMFRQLLRLSSGSNRKTSFEKVIADLLKSFRDDLIIRVQSYVGNKSIIPELDQILIEIQDPKENEYLFEAVSCASSGYLKASVVLGWCATIDRIHHRIEEIGFESFNDASMLMTQQTKGRYKNFNQKQNISSISELRTVFDNVILWIIESMGLIDINQHTRLKSCFDMRCHSGHPGDAPITKFNVLSFFSDLNEIIFKNPKFKLQKAYTSENENSDD